MTKNKKQIEQRQKIQYDEIELDADRITLYLNGDEVDVIDNVEEFVEGALEKSHERVYNEQ